jgi:hypothetical protein
MLQLSHQQPGLSNAPHSLCEDDMVLLMACVEVAKHQSTRSSNLCCGACTAGVVAVWVAETNCGQLMESSSQLGGGELAGACVTHAQKRNVSMAGKIKFN